MKLATLKEGGRDGSLVVVSRDLTRAVRAAGIATTLQDALDRWQACAPLLNTLSEQLNGAIEYTRDPHPVAAAAGEAPHADGEIFLSAAIRTIPQQRADIGREDIGGRRITLAGQIQHLHRLVKEEHPG